MIYRVLDTETSGIEVNDAVCEVAWIDIDENFNVLAEHQSIVDPVVMIKPAASGVHGLVNKDCEAYPTLAEYFSEDDPSCYGKKLDGPSVVIGHRCGFDMRFMSAQFDHEPEQLDTLRWARRLYPESDNHQLSTLIFALDLPRSAGAHRALADVYSAYHLCKHICERTGYTLDQLAQASKGPMEIAVMPFGKHKGEKFSDVPSGWLRWAKNNMKDLDADMVYSIDLQLNKKYNK